MTHDDTHSLEMALALLVHVTVCLMPVMLLLETTSKMLLRKLRRNRRVLEYVVDFERPYGVAAKFLELETTCRAQRRSWPDKTARMHVEQMFEVLTASPRLEPAQWMYYNALLQLDRLALGSLN